MKTKDRILGVIYSAGEGDSLSTRSIAREVGVSHVAVHKHLRRLEEAGLIRRDAGGRPKVVAQ